MIRTLLAAALLSVPALAAAQAYNPGDHAASSQSPAAMFQRPGEDAAAGDGGVRFSGSRAFRAFNCRGGDAVISGDANQLKLTDCSRLTLSGARNQISVVLSSPGDITVSGSRNAVRYRAPDDGAPRVPDNGSDDDIRPTAG